MQTRHAVLFYPDCPFPNTAIMWIEGKGFHCEELPDPCYTLSDLARVAYPRHITHLWIVPQYGEFPHERDNEDWRFSYIETRDKKMMGVSIRKQGHAKIDINVIMCQHTSWWGKDNAPGWMRAAGPYDMLIVLHYLEQVLGITVTGSPGRTGWNYLKKIHPEWIEEIPGINLRESHFTSVSDLVWQLANPLLSALSKAQRKKKYLHKADKNSAYPYAGTQTEVGVGTPVHVDHGYDARHEKGHPQAVGVWKVSIIDVPKLDTYDNMPKPWNGKTESWLAGPIIRLLRATGYNIAIDEGWVFPQKHNVMDKWGNDLWKVRQGFLDPKWVNRKCAALARQATKQIMNTTIGLTAFQDFEDDDEMKRPDIRFQIIARHRELTWHNIDKIRALYKVTPVIVYMDALYYLSDSPDIRDELPELFKRQDQFGGYKWEGRIEMAPEVWAMFDKKMNEAKRLEYLNQIGWTK